MNYPAASNGVSSGNYYRPKGRGIKPLSAEGGLKKMEHSDTITLVTLVHFRHFRHSDREPFVPIHNRAMRH